MSTSSSTDAPQVDRPGIPRDYGISKAKEFVDWGRIEERLSADRVYWIATVGPTGRPRVRPVDGLYLDRTIWVGGSPATRWVQEAESHPAVSVHLDGSDEVIIVEGDAEVIEPMDRAFADRLAAASNAKYPEYGMTADFYERNGSLAIRLRKVIAWTDITRDPTRFRFGR